MSLNSTQDDLAAGRYFLNLNTQVTNIYLIVTSAIGIPGNLISILVFSRLIHQKSNMGLLYLWQSAVDIFFLVISLFFLRGSQMFFNGPVFNSSNCLCKIWAFFRRYSLHISSWVALLTTFDRFTFVLYENRRFKFMRDKRIVSLIIVLMFLVLAVLNFPNFFYNLSPTGSCSATFGFTLSSDLISILLRTYIPMTLMVIFNYNIYKKMKESRHRAVCSTILLRSREKSFTRAVVFTDLVFFITKFPLSISFIVYDSYYYSGVLKSSYYFSWLGLFLDNIFIDISYVDIVFSLFIHLAFNKLFRREFFSLIKCLSPSFIIMSSTNSPRQNGPY